MDLLRKYDTVLIVDDSGSMGYSEGGPGTPSRWDEVFVFQVVSLLLLNQSQAKEALATLAGIAGAYDADGIDIHFLNSRAKGIGMTVSGFYISI